MSEVSHPIIKQLDENLDLYNFYYVRNNDGHPIGIVLLGKKGDIVCRGISICGDEEEKFDKLEGLKYAGQRVLRAFKHGKSEAPLDPLSKYYAVRDLFAHFGGDDLHKVVYNATLTEHEKYILSKSEKAQTNGNELLPQTEKQ